MIAAQGKSLLSGLFWQCVDGFAEYILYGPLRAIFELLQRLVQKYVDSYYCIDEPDRRARQKIFRGRQVWLRRIEGWFLVALSGLFLVLMLFTVCAIINAPLLGIFAYSVGVVYFLNILAFWRDFERFFRGQRYHDDCSYLSPFLRHNDKMTLHFFSIADLIASGALHMSKEAIPGFVLGELKNAIRELGQRAYNGTLDSGMDLRFHQYTLHPGRISQWGFALYQPLWFERIATQLLHMLLWPRVSYLSSFSRPRPLRFSDTLRTTYSKGKVANLSV